MVIYALNLFCASSRCILYPSIDLSIYLLLSYTQLSHFLSVHFRFAQRMAPSFWI